LFYSKMLLLNPNKLKIYQQSHIEKMKPRFVQEKRKRFGE
jgi:hypothetical protein